MLNRQRTIDLRIVHPQPGCGVTTSAGTIDDIEQAAAWLRRAACDRAAAARANSAAGSKEEVWDLEEMALSDDEDDDASYTIRVRTLPVAGSIGGKIWDASLLMSAWIIEHRHHFPGVGGRLLELGSGLGIAGLAAARALPLLHVTLSDYDPAVIANLHETVSDCGARTAIAASLKA